MNHHFQRLAEEIGVNYQKNQLNEITKILRYFADRFPFENLDVLLKNQASITSEFLINKLIVEQRGGLCYELNPFLYLFLKELGCDVQLMAGTVRSENGWGTDGTHIFTKLTFVQKDYLLDVGFGNNLSLTPIEFEGEPVESPAGTFRVTRKETEKGVYCMEMQEDDQWIIKYGFYLQPVTLEDMNHVKETIHNNKSSHFNTRLIFARCLADRTISINNERLRYRYLKTRSEESFPFASETELLKAAKEQTNESVYKKIQQYFSTIS